MILKPPTDDALDIYEDGVRTNVGPGEKLERTGDAAQRLLDQGWVRVDKPKARTTDDSKDGE